MHSEVLIFDIIIWLSALSTCCTYFYDHTVFNWFIQTVMHIVSSFQYVTCISKSLNTVWKKRLINEQKYLLVHANCRDNARFQNLFVSVLYVQQWDWQFDHQRIQCRNLSQIRSHFVRTRALVEWRLLQSRLLRPSRLVQPVLWSPTKVHHVLRLNRFHVWYSFFKF